MSQWSGIRVSPLNPRTRRRFDQQLERVLEKLPRLVHRLIEKVPLHVEDYPSPAVLEEMGIEYRDELCGLFTGMPLTQRSVDHSGTLPDVVTIYREGILAAAADDDGRIRSDRLREQIRITILHELAHFHGLNEDELRELGYG
jgi:predicted Zn-dependent protease with MMP-like domain